MMKLLLAIVAFATSTSFTEHASAQAAASNISAGFTASTRQFNTSRTDTSQSCSKKISSDGTCPPLTGYVRLLKGYYTDGNPCCTYTKLLEGQDAEQTEQLLQTEADQQSLSEVFSQDGRVEAYWGYITTSNRSPSGGRGNSGPARLDACIGHGETDLLGTGSSGWMNCYSKCDSTTNGYCNNTATNNGSSMTNAPCKDRCDCTITGFGTCEGI